MVEKNKILNLMKGKSEGGDQLEAVNVAQVLDIMKEGSVHKEEIIDAISEARAHGDLKENAEYHAAREEQGLNEARIRELEEVLSISQVVEYTTMGVEDRVIFGSTVTIKDLEF